MTTRRFNFTGCRRVRRADVQIRLETKDAVHSFSVSYRLADYDLPETAEVVIEAFVDWTVMRFQFGTVAIRVDPGSTELSEFGSIDGVRFRLKVLGTGDQTGLILAEADKLRPSDLELSEAANSFVTVRPSDLGSVVWRLTFDESQPVLHVNERLDDWKSFLRRPIMRSLLIPEVLRQVVREAVQRGEDEDESEAWENHALKLAYPLAAGEPPTSGDPDEIDQWVDGVVRKFAQRHKLWQGVADYVDGGEE